MERFITAERTWAERSRWHVYVLPDLDTDPDLRRLVAQSNEVLARYPSALSVVSEPWLHATMQMVTGVAGDDVGEARRAALISALHDEVGGLPPFTATAGAVQAGRAGVAVDLDQDLPGEPFAVLGERVRAAIRAPDRQVRRVVSAAGNQPPVSPAAPASRCRARRRPPGRRAAAAG
ncbi:hypothetical protein [Dactylosporangium sp. NPDC000521]|uniref:hypothetical protein n=1 Tax=Dactylosporangium sp. NPDC000521 TaxID=3363975 RepID=UPI003680B27C